MPNVVAQRVWALLADWAIKGEFDCGSVCLGVAVALAQGRPRNEQSVWLNDLPPLGSYWCLPSVISSFSLNVHIWKAGQLE